MALLCINKKKWPLLWRQRFILMLFLSFANLYCGIRGAPRVPDQPPPIGSGMGAAALDSKVKGIPDGGQIKEDAEDQTKKAKNKIEIEI